MVIDTIYHGDNVEIMRTFPEGCIDLCVTSPPYDDLRTYGGEVLWDFEEVAKNLYRILKPGATLVWIVCDSYEKSSKTLTSFKQALYFKEIVGFFVNDVIIWDKGGTAQVGGYPYRYGQCFEYMFILTKGKGKTFNPIKDRKNISFGRKLSGTNRERDGSMRKISGTGKAIPQWGQRFNIWNTPPEKTRITAGHPAPFPEKIVRDHIQSWSNEGDLVLDPFCGSGTVPVVAAKMNRHYVGIEVHKPYIEIAQKRLKPVENGLFTAQKEQSLG